MGAIRGKETVGSREGGARGRARRGRARAAALAALLLLASPSFAAPPSATAQAPATPSPITWYAERITGGDLPTRMEHLWSRDGWLRAETVIAGRPIITLVRGERYVMLDPAENRGISIQRSPRAIAQDDPTRRVFGNELEALVAQGGEKVREEKLGGVTCDLYRLTDARGRTEVCVTRDDQKLPRMIRAWSRRTGNQSEIRYVQWIRDLDLSPDFFTPDPRIPLESYGYDAYVAALEKGPVGPAPPLFPELLHGPREP